MSALASCMFAASVFSQSSARKPFIVYQIERMFSETNHTNPATVLSMYARRSDGSEVYSFNTSAPNGAIVEMRNVRDLRRNAELILDTSAGTVMTFHYAPGKLVATLTPYQRCSSEALSAQREVILGRTVAVYTESLPELRVTSHLKVALDLDCYPLYTSDSFASGALNETEVTSVLMVDPPDSLFDAPPDYREVSPSQADAEYRKKYPGNSLWSKQFLVTLDQRYYSNR